MKDPATASPDFVQTLVDPDSEEPGKVRARLSVTGYMDLTFVEINVLGGSLHQVAFGYQDGEIAVFLAEDADGDCDAIATFEHGGTVVRDNTGEGSVRFDFDGISY